MAVNVFPAPVAGASIPEGLRPPKITYSNSWDLSDLSGISSITQYAMMTYRPTDNNIYFMGKNSDDLYSFNLDTKTSSADKTAPASMTSAKDIVSAQDGTLYAAEAEGLANTVTVYYSTDGGTSWTSMGQTLQTGKGFLTVIDNGTIPGITGNVVWSNTGNTTTGTQIDRVFINNVNTSENFLERQEDVIDVLGGRIYFPVKDGDDVSFNGKCILLSTAETNSNPWNPGSFGPSQVVCRYATVGVRVSASATANIALTNNLPDFTLTSTNTVRNTVGRHTGGKPTTIQSRWIIMPNQTSNTDSAFLSIIDYENNFSRVGSVPLKMVGDFSGLTQARDVSNPIYISATKKLYISIINGSAGARMYEYDVTTY
jgi:hypothetical protein